MALPLPLPQGYNREVSYLVTQYPLEDTRYEFWLMVLQHRVNSVAMVGPLDNHQPQALYWQADQPLVVQGITVTLETEVQSRAFRRLDFTVSAPEVSSNIVEVTWPRPSPRLLSGRLATIHWRCPSTTSTPGPVAMSWLPWCLSGCLSLVKWKGVLSLPLSCTPRPGEATHLQHAALKQWTTHTPLCPPPQCGLG